MPHTLTLSEPLPLCDGEGDPDELTHTVPLTVTTSVVGRGLTLDVAHPVTLSDDESLKLALGDPLPLYDGVVDGVVLTHADPLIVATCVVGSGLALDVTHALELSDALRHGLLLADAD